MHDLSLTGTAPVDRRLPGRNARFASAMGRTSG